MLENINNGQVSENTEIPSENQNMFDRETVQRLIQSEADKVRGKYSLELKKKDEELKKKDEEIKKIRSEYLNAEELAKIEFEETKRESEENKRAYTIEKNKNFARDMLSKYKLETNSEKTRNLIRLVSGETEKDIEENVSDLSGAIEEILQNRIGKQIHSSGRKVTRSSGDVELSHNPWAKGSFNLTEQMQIQINNPELAQKLMTQANLIP